MATMPPRFMQARPSRGNAPPRAATFACPRSANVRSGSGSNVASICQRSLIASIDGHTPSASPARYAAPSAVVSWSIGRCTVTPNWSACICNNTSITDAPPSTRNAASGVPLAAAIASTDIAGLVGHGFHDSAGDVRLRRAAGDPDDCATRDTDPTTGCRARQRLEPRRHHRCRACWPPSGPMSAAESIRPKPSRSHWIAAPVTKIAPSKRVGDGSVGELPGDGREHALCRWWAGRADVQQHEAAGSVRVLGHPRREARLADQGCLLIAGDAGDRDPARAPCRLRRLAEPTTRREDRSAARRSARRTGRTSRATTAAMRMSNSIVRLALVGSVTCAAPPVRFQISHESIVPSASWSSIGNVSIGQQPLELRCREVGIQHESSRVRAPAAGGRRCAAARIGQRCGGPATRWPMPYGLPVCRFQATTVSRWLAIPIAATDSLPDLADDLVEGGQRDRPRSPRRRARPSLACG